MSSRGGPGAGTGGVACPECGHREAFVTFTDEGACPECETPLGQLLDAGRRSR